MSKSIPLSDILNSAVNNRAGNVSAQRFMAALNGEKGTAQGTDTMKIHIEIGHTARNGDSLIVRADIGNQGDLAVFHETYRGYLPRKKLWGIL